jgi:hypothetical protein
VTVVVKLLLAVGIVAAVALAPCATVLAVPPDAAAPAELQLKLPAAKDAVVDGLDRHQWTRARFVGMESRASDNLVVIMFELYGWPNVFPVRAFLMSRCRALADIEPGSMSGGLVDDFASDPELQHLRSPAQSAC